MRGGRKGGLTPVRLEMTQQARWDDAAGNEVRSFEITLYDHTSGVTIFSADLTTDEWAALTAGTSRRLEAFVGEADELAKIRKKMQNESVAVPVEVYEHHRGKSFLDRRAPEEIYEWAEAHREAHGWDSFDAPRMTNRSEWEVVFRRWIDPT